MIRFARLLAVKGNVPRGRVGAWDGVRVLCVSMVACFHFWQQSWLSPDIHVFGVTLTLAPYVRTGYLFVDGLVLLSGFLLFLPYAQAALEGRPLPRVRMFYKRRAARIVPSYVFSLLVMLFAFALPDGSYHSVGDMIADLAAHLSFTHTWFPQTYHGTPLGGVLWTLGVEVQFYLISPFVARAFIKKPLATYAGMTFAAAGFRAFVQWQSDVSMLFNQLPAFLDVYANGFACALVYVSLKRMLDQKSPRGALPVRLACLAVCVMGFVVVTLICIGQASATDIEAGQMARRFPLSCAMGSILVCAPLVPRALRWVLDNPVTAFLSGISFNFYIWHQTVALRLKLWGIPASDAAAPWRSDAAWQTRYSALCWICAFVLAVLITYCVEKPIAALWLKQKRSGSQ